MQKSFSERVLLLCSKVPKGKVTTYLQIAKALGKPKSSRAVGNALNKNKTPVKIPCHRVIRSDGRVGGYAFGKGKKIKLLLSEGIAVQEGKVDLSRFLFCP